jgi:hypothetical protein
MFFAGMTIATRLVMKVVSTLTTVPSFNKRFSPP